jgi:hypothetical protein
MRGRRLRSGSLMALFAALVLVLGAAPSFARTKGVHSEKPAPRKFDYPHRADRVTIYFNKALVAQGTEDKATSITVQDECGRTLSNSQTLRRTMSPAQEGDPVERAWVELDRRNKNPNGRYSVVVSYWLAEDEEGNSENPDEDDAANQEPLIYEYWFQVHGGPNCDGSSSGGHHQKGDKKGVWGGTGGSGHHGGDQSGNPNLRTAGSTTSTGHTGHSLSPNLGSYTSPSLGDDHDDNHTGSTMTPFGDDDIGDPFGDATGSSPLSDPTDPSLYQSEAGQIPEEASDQQTLSAAPTDDLGPESGTLVVALATALLLGAGGGLFLRKSDPAPVRSRS